MRSLLGIMAACLLGLANPASAQLVQLSISGTMQGTQSTIMCGPGASLSCFATYANGNRTESYQSDFVRALVPAELVQGDNPFSFGALRGGGLWTGVINNSNGLLTGRDLFYSFESNGVRFGTVGSSTITASARSFTITAVPEPATWALMLLGFLAVGTALRRVPRRALVPA